MRITTATFSAAAMLFAISSSLPQLAPQGEKSELDHGNTNYSRRLFSRGSKESRNQGSTTCSGRTMYDDTIANDIKTAAAMANTYCDDLSDSQVYNPFTVNNIQFYICNYDGGGCSQTDEIEIAIKNIGDSCGPHSGGWYNGDYNYGLDPAGQAEC